MRPLLSITCRFDPTLAGLAISKDDRRLLGHLATRDIAVRLVCTDVAAYECRVRVLIQCLRYNPILRAWILSSTTPGLVRVARSLPVQGRV